MAISNAGKEIIFETNHPANDSRRVLYVGKEGSIFDLRPSGKPPIIGGFGHAHRNRILVDTDNTGVFFDIHPDAIGLTAQAIQALRIIYP